MSTWYKQGVYGTLTIEAAEALRQLEKLFASTEDIFITSIREGTHMPGSFHPSGRALDIRKPKAISIHEIRNRLGTNFDVIEEHDHIHIEYDPKK